MKKCIITMLLSLVALGASAQTILKSSYFVDGVMMRHKLNPAFMGESGYFAMPFLGGLDINVKSNLSLDKIFYPLENGNLGLFLHPEVDRELARSSFDENNLINQNLSMSILSTGFYAFGGYNTIDFSVRESLNVNLSGSLFDFLLGGEPDATSVFQMGGNTVDLTVYTELAVGHAHKINDNLTVGAKLKYLAGAGDAHVAIDRLSLTSRSDMLAIDAAASGQMSALGLPLNGKPSEMELDFLDMSIPAGGGFAVDLGATYKLDNFDFSFALNDLGSIGWNNASGVDMSANVEFGGFPELDLKDFEGSTSGTVDDLEKELDTLVEPEFVPINNYKTTICPTMNIAAEYSFFDNQLSAGLLSSTYFSSNVVTDFMLAATYSPTNWFSFALTGTTTTLGATYWGWVMSLSPSWINFYIGSDSMFAKVTPQGIPLSTSNLNLSFGLSFPFGGN